MSYVKSILRRRTEPVMAVRGCASCPFSIGDSADWCGADPRSRSLASVDVDIASPAWCPVRGDGIRVQFADAKPDQG